MRFAEAGGNSRESGCFGVFVSRPRTLIGRPNRSDESQRVGGYAFVLWPEKRTCKVSWDSYDDGNSAV